MKQRKPYEIREFICPPITAAELTEDNPVWQTVQQTARRLLEKYGEAKGVSPDRFDTEQDVLTVEAHYLCVRIHAAIINGAERTLGEHLYDLGEEYAPHRNELPDAKWVVALAYMALKMTELTKPYKRVIEDCDRLGEAYEVVHDQLRSTDCPRGRELDELKLEPSIPCVKDLPDTHEFWYMALNKGIKSINGTSREEESHQDILALYPAENDRMAVEAKIENAFDPDKRLLRGLKALEEAGRLNTTPSYAEVLRLLRMNMLEGEWPKMKSVKSFVEKLDAIGWKGSKGIPSSGALQKEIRKKDDKLVKPFTQTAEGEFIDILSKA